MFTLKLYRHHPDGGLITRVLAVHHVQTQEVGENSHTLSLWAFHHQEPSGYDAFTIGERLLDTNEQPLPEGVTRAYAYSDPHWEWGLLENWEGNTSQHFRPHSYGSLRAA